MLCRGVDNVTISLQNSVIRYQSVLQAAKVGQMLIELKAVTAHGEYCSRVNNLGMKHPTPFRLMTLARNQSLIEEKKPESQRAG